MFKKKAAAAAVSVQKIENRDLMEAIVAGSILVAYADGDCSTDELSKMQSIIEANDNLKHFGAEIGQTVDKYCAKMEAGKRMGKMQLMKEMEDVASSSDEKEQAFIIAIEVADADGDISEVEHAVLTEIGKAFGLNAEKYI